MQLAPRAHDPLFANRAYPGAVPNSIIPGPEGDVVVTGLPDFVRTKGTAFFLLPSQSMLRALL